ncbi:unnamed protein product [Meloidogyne enterolobii]|uniref:Uncharacterized protein n=1 Tax=Meloidogyne enterolobii TaxID=390850 RepID=A0ACB0YA90_MELEN
MYIVFYFSDLLEEQERLNLYMEMFSHPIGHKLGITPAVHIRISTLMADLLNSHPNLYEMKIFKTGWEKKVLKGEMNNQSLILDKIAKLYLEINQDKGEILNKLINYAEDELIEIYLNKKEFKEFLLKNRGARGRIVKYLDIEEEIRHRLFAGIYPKIGPIICNSKLRQIFFNLITEKLKYFIKNFN